MQLTASGGPPGSAITLAGSSGAPGAPVTVYSKAGNAIPLSLASPPGAVPGAYTISLTAAANGVSIGASISVVIATLSPAAIVSPVPGYIAPGPWTFTWNSGVGATEYIFSISGAGFSFGPTTTSGQSINVANIPAIASPVTITLQSLIGGVWEIQTYLYSLQTTPAPLSLGTLRLRKNGQPVTINSPPSGSDTITGCSGIAGGSTSILQTGFATPQQAISFSAGPTSPIGANPFSCTSQQGVTMAGILGVDDDPDFTITSSTQDLNTGAWTFVLTADFQDGFGDDGYVQMPGAQITTSWGENQITVTAQVPSCNTYDIKVVLADPGEFSVLEGDGPPEADATTPEVCPLSMPTPSGFTISGVVLASNGKPLKGVTVSLSGSNLPLGGPLPTAQTDGNGNYSLSATPVGPSCGNAQVSATFGSPYTIPFTPYGPNGQPSNGYFPCAQGQQTLNFTAGPFTTVFVIHGIDQGFAGVQTLTNNLAQGGVDTGRFYVDGGFDFSECTTQRKCTVSTATPTLPSMSCGISTGGKKLADYILNVSGHDPGSIILVGYSLGGLVARDLLLNGGSPGSPSDPGYQNVLTTNTVAGVVTIGTPNWGYPYVAGLDDLVNCPALVQDMAGSWNTTNPQSPTTSNMLSAYLRTLDGGWTPSAYAGYWLAAAGKYCGLQQRVNPLANENPASATFPVGCFEPIGVYSNDGVVCADSAEYGTYNLTPPAGQPTKSFNDPNHQYAHTAGPAWASLWGVQPTATP